MIETEDCNVAVARDMHSAVMHDLFIEFFSDLDRRATVSPTWQMNRRDLTRRGRERLEKSDAGDFDLPARRDAACDVEVHDVDVLTTTQVWAISDPKLLAEVVAVLPLGRSGVHHHQEGGESEKGEE